MSFLPMSSKEHQKGALLPPGIADNAISCTQRTFSLLAPNDQKRIRETADLIKEEIGQGLISDKLIQELSCYEEFINNNLKIDEKTSVNNQSIKDLKDCFNEIYKIKILFDYPEDINKLQRIFLERKRPKDSSGRVEDIETNSSFWETAEDYIPFVELGSGVPEFYAGLNDSLEPMMQLLQKMLDKNIRCLETEEYIRKAFVSKIRLRSSGSGCDYSTAFDADLAFEYEDFLPNFRSWKFFIPFYQIKQLHDFRKENKKFGELFEKYKEVIVQSELLACTISILSKALKDYGGECGYGKPMCFFKFHKKYNLLVVRKIDSDELLFQFEEAIHEIYREYTSIESRLKMLRAFLKFTEIDQNPRSDNSLTCWFCFLINRISQILEGYENYRQGKTLEELKAMSNLRKDINRFVIEYKIKYVSHTEPILGVEILRCKVVVDNPFRKMVFLEKMDALHFRQRIDHALDGKAQNISRTYPDENFSSQEIREIAEKLNPDSYKDMVEKLQKEQNKMEADAKKMEAFAEEYFSKSTLSQINLIGSVAKFGAECVGWGIHEAKEFLALKADLQRILAGCSGVPSADGLTNILLTKIGGLIFQFIKSKIQNWIGTEKQNKDKKKGSVAKNEETNEKGGGKKETSKKEEADKKVDITKKEEADKKEHIVKKEETDKKGEVDEKEENDKKGQANQKEKTNEKEEADKKEIISQSDASNIKKEFPELNLSPQYIEEFAKGCEYMINADEIRKNIIMVSNQKEYWKRVQCYEQDFINLLKLNIQLKRAKLDEMDFQGILVDEKKAVRRNDKSGANLARFNEYSVEKLNCIE
ncbi:uncharacterized protein MONOS_2937 [Monocercomonoides exilis]|uniref:uncharacterized protein n=1 Tax=Monocercomonoides exilis TaxID=2049356 RepID=UPI003559DAE5|nr:hypothetical protein MONOS_2937 [Monocercomonoides exilis]|eukprot:MONOS_2937.1-p1 / transcript=MONOS_2937.1 / gene=MONOS_2937 / organism=Monocercomonoides_exilis_PA203 / gene_product=putative uncharacterized protein / transcript_product=putative uncharacterized protein / location=Mono_scaffold00064:95002-97455(+) / protein_length=817 / sequence_SO=supercontig / SO=protein_coding / is_pseudo=false